MKLKVLSWNIWIDGHFDKVVQFLKNSKAEIICLQEATDNNTHNVIKFLENLGYNYVFASTLQTWDGKKHKHGVAIFSKYKIANSRTCMLSEENVRMAVRADIKTDNRILHIFSTHLIHTHQKSSKIQEEQARNLADLIPRKNTILTGDFNATPESKTIKLFKNILVDTDKQSQPTWSVYRDGCQLENLDKVTIRLDYIFATKDINSSSFEVGQSQGSDHLPISVTVEV